jgi:ParB-like chromosome segregation protein Spo0J
MTTNIRSAQKIEHWPLDRLVPYDRNARTHSAEQVAQISASIQEFGFTNPILVASDDGIIAGHGRLQAAQELALDTVPVVVLDHLTPAQRRAYVLADNKLALNAGWDDALLAEEITALHLEDFELSTLGWSDSDIADMLDPEGIDEPAKEYEGSQEYEEDEFSEFEHKCPRCGFEFNGNK